MDNDKEMKVQLEDLFSELEDPIVAKEDMLVSLKGLIEDVTERKQTQKQRIIFRALVENGIDAITVSDLEGCQTYSNRACYEVFGYDHENQEMNDLSLVNLWPAEDTFTFPGQVLPQAKAGSWSGEVQLKRRGGTLFDAYLTAFPVLDKAGQPISIAIIIRDISERKRLERERNTMHENRARQVRLITEVAQEIAAAPALDELYRRVVTLVKERFGYYHVQLYRYDPELDDMVVVESYVQAGGEMSAASHRSSHNGNRGIVVTASATGQPVLVSDVSQNPHWVAHPDLPDVKGELVVPIKLRGQVLGVLDVLSDTVGTLTREDEIVLLELAGQIASAMEKTRLLEEANILRQFGKAPEGIGWITLEGSIIIYINPTLCSILGEAKPEDTFGRSIISYYPRELRQRVQNEILPTVLREGQWIGELAFLSARGKITSTIQSIFLIRDENGNPLYLANVVTDITEQKQAEFLLNKRAEQINCLNEIGRRIDETPQVPEFLQWVAERIPPAMQYPDVCVAAVEFEDTDHSGRAVYGVAKAVEMPCQIVEGLSIGGETVGQMYLSYTQAHDFLDEERALLGDIARRVSNYIESRRLLEQTRDALTEVKTTHQHYMPGQWTRLAPQQTSPESAQPDTPPPGDDGLQARPRGSRVGAALRKTWQRVITGLSALVILFLLGTLLTWTFGLQVQADPPAALAVALPFSSPSPTVALFPRLTTTPSLIYRPISSPPHVSTPSSPPSLAPTLSSSHASFIVPEPFPAIDPNVPATVSTTLPIPTPVPPVPVAADAVNIVVLGSDRRPDWSEWHTDAVHVVSIQRDRGEVSVISIPRDVYLYVPGFWMSRINFADFYGEAYDYEGEGPALVRDTLLYNLGIRVDYFVRTNFDGLIGIVDTLGGVDIPVHCRLSDYWPYPDENGEYPILTMEPGIHHLDGETALWYTRSRMTTSVFSRDRRQQQVLRAIWHKARDAGMLSQVPALWRQGRDMVKTDLTLTDILDLAQIAFTLEDQNVRFYNIGADEVTPWTTPYGGGVFLPRWEDIKPILAEAMAPIPEARLSRTYMPVEVWNGTSNPDWDLLAADRLYQAGFPAVAGEPERRDYAETQLIVFSEHIKGTGVEYLQQTFQIPDDQVIHQPHVSSEFGFRLILGADYQTCPQP